VPGLKSEEDAVKVRQIVEFRTSRIDEFNAYFDQWIAASEGDRIPHRAVLQADRDAGDVYLLTVEFSSHEQAKENSARPRTGEFAAFLRSISDGGLAFRNLDVVREDDL
jgi:hypothetical protein